MRRVIPQSGRSELSYHIVDVFTDQPYAGNPLAVVLGADELTTEQMQQLAAEFNLSETAFPLAPTPQEKTAGADYRLRIFTPVVELPFAGHPSIGTAWLMRQLELTTSATLYQLCGAGLLPLEFGEDGVTLTGGEPVLGREVDPQLALSAVGLTNADLAAPAQVASAGLAYVVLPVETSAMGQCAPDVTLLKEHFGYPSEASGIYVVSWGSKPDQVSARMFAGDIGTAEDAATGSAALALGVYLGGNGHLAGPDSRFEVTQGVAMGRPSRLVVTADVGNGVVRKVQVAGTAAHVAQGVLNVPG